MNKIIGYIIALIGLVALVASTIPPVKKIISIIPESLSNTYLMIGSLIVIAIGILLAFKSSSSQKASEVPIYSGKEVVGYRRLGK